MNLDKVLKKAPYLPQPVDVNRGEKGKKGGDNCETSNS